jgi:hypothetical protein
MLTPLQRGWLTPLERGANFLIPLERGARCHTAAMGPAWAQVELVAALPPLATVIVAMARDEVELLGLGDRALQRMLAPDARDLLDTMHRAVVAAGVDLPRAPIGLDAHGDQDAQHRGIPHRDLPQEPAQGVVDVVLLPGRCRLGLLWGGGPVAWSVSPVAWPVGPISVVIHSTQSLPSMVDPTERAGLFGTKRLTWLTYSGTSWSRGPSPSVRPALGRHGCEPWTPFFFAPAPCRV